MIIAQGQGRLRLTLQTDHALLAGEIAAAWGGALFARPEPMDAIRLAVDLHDEGWAEVDREPRIHPATGRPYDFRDIPQDIHIDAYGRCIQRALDAHPYAGLLVSLHGTGLYRHRYGHLPHLPFRRVDPAHKGAAERFLAAQEDLQMRLTEELAPDPVVLWTHYRWLQVWDMISVFACMADPAERFSQLLGAMPQYPGGPDEPLIMRSAGGERFTLDPWPFAVEQISLLWPARWVEDRRYSSDGEFQAAFDVAEVEIESVSIGPA